MVLAREGRGSKIQLLLTSFVNVPFPPSFLWYRWWRSSWWQWHCNTLWWNCESRSKVNRDTIAPMFEHRRVPFVCLLNVDVDLSFTYKHSLKGMEALMIVLPNFRTWTWAPPQNKLSLMRDRLIDSEALLAHSPSQCVFLFCLQIGGKRQPFVFAHLELIGRIMGWLNQLSSSVIRADSLPSSNSTLNWFTLYPHSLATFCSSKLFLKSNPSPVSPHPLCSGGNVPSQVRGIRNLKSYNFHNSATSCSISGCHASYESYVGPLSSDVW